MTAHSTRLAVALTVTLVPRVAMAQHEGHQMGGSAGSPEMTQCAHVVPLVENIVAAAMTRAESARQSNTPAEMRAAVDHLEASLRDIRAQLEPCEAAAAAADPHAGHTMPGMQQPPGAPAAATPPPANVADPHAGHAMSGQQSEMPMDPVNGAMVDPATAPKTVYQGKTYYFSSEQTRKEFLANPANFAKKNP